MFKGMNYVYEVYKEGGFKNASEKLFVSQPSLSASVRRVEERVGYPIFDRSIRPLQLTECGQKYIEAVEKIYQIEESFANYVNDLGELKNGSLKIGGTSISTSLLLPPILMEYKKRYPQIDIEIAEGTTNDLTRMVLSGEYDMVIDYGITETELLDFEKIHEDYLILSVPAEYKENESLKKYQISYEDIKSGAFKNEGVPSVSPAAFKEEPFVLLKQKNNTRTLTDKFFERYDFKPTVTFDAAQQMSAYFANSEGIGCAFVSSTLLSGLPENKNLVYYKLDPDISLRYLSFFWKSGRYVSRAMQEFINITKKILSK